MALLMHRRVLANCEESTQIYSFSGGKLTSRVFNRTRATNAYNDINDIQ